MLTPATLLEQKCRHQVDALSQDDISAGLAALPGWSLESNKLVKSFDFTDYHETLAFLTAIAYVIHAEDHHPELVLTYNRCVVRFDTHSVNGGQGGISENDFICAAKVDAIYQQSFAGTAAR